MESKNEAWIKAITPPSATQVAYRVFKFLRANRDEAEQMVSGMQSFVKGFDKLYLCNLADRSGVINMARYDFAMEYYKNKILKQQAENSKKNES